MLDSYSFQIIFLSLNLHPSESDEGMDLSSLDPDFRQFLKLQSEFVDTGPSWNPGKWVKDQPFFDCCGLTFTSPRFYSFLLAQSI